MRTTTPMNEWKSAEPIPSYGIGGDAFNAMPELGRDSLSSLSSDAVSTDFPELEYVPPADRHKIEIDENVEDKMAEDTKTPFSSPLVGIAMISVIAGGFFVVTRGLSN